jgi:hypothetical protein
MGDRGNVRLIGRDGEVWFYTHWRGTEIPEALKDALKRGRDRWDDEPYLNRIIFDSLTAGGKNETTGFGISAGIGDNQHGRPIAVVDHVKARVYAQGEDDAAAKKPPTGAAFTFEQIVAAENPAELLGFE